MRPVSNEPCLICGRRPSDWHHWPIARGTHPRREWPYLPVVPLCRKHHTQAHTGRLTEDLICLAPRYWMEDPEVASIYMPRYETWLAKREYMEAVS